MELTAVREALAAHPGADILIQTDSDLIVKTFTVWLAGWSATACAQEIDPRQQPLPGEPSLH
jgi:hypothetical protein